MVDLADDPTGKAQEPARGDRATAIAIWAGIAVLTFGIQLLVRRSGIRSGVGPGEVLFSGFSQFDGPEYLSIARDGYEARQLVWFPLYPLSIRAVTLIVRDGLLAGVVISLACGAGAVAVYWRWLELQLRSRSERFTALAVLLLYPFGWFLFGIVYSDAMYLLLVVSAFLLLEHRNYLAAGIVGALATATRPSGIVLVLALAVLAAERSGALRAPSPERFPILASLRFPLVPSIRKLDPRALLVLLSVAGVLTYCLYLWLVWDDPIRFVTEQRRYHDPGLATFLKEEYFAAFGHGRALPELVSTTAQAAVLILAIGSVPAVGRRFGWGYGVFVLGVALMPAFSVATFMGTGRYLMVAFPLFALLGEWLAERPRLRAGYITCGALILVGMVAMFSRSFYLT